MLRRRLLPPAVLLLTLLASPPACAPRPDEAARATASALPGTPLAALPTKLTAALDSFRAEGPRGWAFTQTTVGEGKNLVERHDPGRRGAGRWTLLAENGAPPTEEQQQRYRDTRPPFDASSHLAAQFDRERASLVGEDETSATYEFALKPANEDDSAAAHMRARVTLDHASGAIVRVELFNFRSFKPARSLTIHEARTTLTYSPPADGRPALPLESRFQVRGERFWFRDFEQKITSTFSDHEDAAAPRAAPEPPNAATAGEPDATIGAQKNP